MGTPGKTDFDVADDSVPVVAGEDGNLDAALDVAYKARPSSAPSSEADQAEEEIISSTKGQYFPSISSLSGTAARSGGSLEEPPGRRRQPDLAVLSGRSCTKAQVRRGRVGGGVD